MPEENQRFKSPNSDGNTTKFINTSVIPVIRYAAGIVDWVQTEAEALGRGKKMTLNHVIE